MASGISTTGIDATKPAFDTSAVSSEIRNNFSEIKTQLNTAASEISALQSTDSDKQDKDATLTALAAFANAGLMVHRGSDDFTARQLVAPAAGLTISDPGGTSGNPTIALANDLAGVEGISGTGLAVRTAADAWTSRAIAVAVGLAINNAGGITGNPTLALDINGMTAETSPADADLVGIYDASAATHRAMTRANFLTGVSAVGKQTIWIPARAWKGRSTNGAASGSRELTANNMMVESLDFDPGAIEYAQFPIRMPKSWDEGTVSFEVDWTASTGAGAVVWELQGLALSNDDALTATFGNACSVVDTLIATNDVHKTGESTACTIGGSPAEGDFVVLQISRNATSGSDTHTSDAQMLGVSLFITTNAGTDS